MFELQNVECKIIFLMLGELASNICFCSWIEQNSFWPAVVVCVILMWYILLLLSMLLKSQHWSSVYSF